MRILHLGATYPPYPGGMGNVMKEEAVRLVARGHSVTVVTLTAQGTTSGIQEEAGVTVVRVRPQIRWGKSGYSWKLISYLRDASFDAVHVHLPFFGCQEVLAILCWLGLAPKRFVVSYHMDIVSSGLVRLIAQVSRRCFLPTVIRRARMVFVASLSYAQTSWIAPFKKRELVELPFGVDLQRFYPDNHEEGPVRRLLFLGGLDRNHYFKGLTYALNALAQLSDRSDWTLDIVGDGDLRSGYEQDVKRLGLEGRVTFLGRVSDQDVSAVYRRSDVFLFPSTDRSEAFGLVALEAQASGVPVIASDLDGVREVIEDGKTGWLTPPRQTGALRDVIERVLHATSLASERKAARRRAERLYDWDQHVTSLELQYEALCASLS